MSVSAPDDGALTYFDGDPPTCGVSEVVVAPPQTLVDPFAIEQVPEKVPIALAGSPPHVPDVDHESNVSMMALALDGGPCTNGGETYAVIPSPLATAGDVVKEIPVRTAMVEARMQEPIEILKNLKLIDREYAIFTPQSS